MAERSSLSTVPGTERETRRIYSVSELTRKIKSLLETSLPAVWVEGEISKPVLSQKGHLYFSLKDADAVLDCAMFRSEFSGLKFEVAQGLAVLALGRISVWPPSGRYQLTVERLEPKGVGALQIRFQQLKEKLEREGLFDPARKKPLPFFPRRVGLVTSPQGDALRDLLKNLHRRCPNLEIVINPVHVQGDRAAGEIAAAVDEFNRLGGIDVVIVARGGGSLEDLWAFNEETVARAIARSRIPVVSAIGHERDYTMADFVADLRAPTPSTAAELVVPSLEDLRARLGQSRERLDGALDDFLAACADRLRQMADAYVLRKPLILVEQVESNLEQKVETLHRLLRDRLWRLEVRGSGLVAKLEALSPLAILSRGYSVSLMLPERRVVRDPKRLKTGDRVETIVEKGRFTSRVEEVAQ